MSKLIQKSEEAILDNYSKYNFELFEAKDTNTTVQSSHYVNYLPINGLPKQGGSGSIHFLIPAVAKEYVALSETLLYLRLRLTKENGEDIDMDSNVCTINLPMNTLFSEAQIYIGGQLLSANNNLFPYKAFIKTLLEKGGQDGSPLANQLFTVDNNAGSLPNEQNKDPGVQKRWKTQRWAEFDVSGKLFLDALDIKKPLLQGTSIEIKLWQGRNSFNLLSGDDEKYKIVIEEAVLKLLQLQVNDSILVAQEEALKVKNAIYEFNRIQLKTKPIQQNCSSFVWENINNSGRLPKYLVCGLTTNSCFAGDYKKSPFYFGTHKVRTIGLYLNGVSIPTREISVNYAKGLFADAVERFTQGRETVVSRDSFTKGYALYFFQVDVDCEKQLLNLEKNGSLRLEISFDITQDDALDIELPDLPPPNLLPAGTTIIDAANNQGGTTTQPSTSADSNSAADAAGDNGPPAKRARRSLQTANQIKSIFQNH